MRSIPALVGWMRLNFARREAGDSLGLNHIEKLPGCLLLDADAAPQIIAFADYFTLRPP